MVRTLAVPLHDGDRLLIDIAALGESHARRIEDRVSVFVLVAAGGHFFKIFGRALRLQAARLSTSPPETKGPCTRLMRPPPAM
jgi:hypothetical protein